MNEQESQQIGDRVDHYGEAARQIASAVQQMGRGTSAQHVATGATAVSNAAAAAVRTGAESGRVVAAAASGTAVGGPWGAALAATWSLRHTVSKVLIASCLALLIMVVLIVSLPAVVTNDVFGLDGSAVDTEHPITILESYNDLASAVSACVDEGYRLSLDKVEEIIRDGDYDYELSMEALINYAQSSAGYDVSYILAAYSVSRQQQNTSKEDLITKLNNVAEDMFLVTHTEGAQENGGKDGEPVKYVECTIHPFNQAVIMEAFSIDPDAIYDQFGVANSEAIQNMANALKMTLYGSLGNGQTVPLTDAELIAFVERQDCNAARKHLLATALSLVGKVPYFWGGRSEAGWNDAWNTPRLVTAAGSSSTGTIRPYGLDCSGFTDWAYKTALGVSLYNGSWRQWDATYAITEEELLPGDLGFMAVPGTVPINHVLMYAGIGNNGEQMWVHCSSGSGVVLNSPDYVTQYRRPSHVDLDGTDFAGAGSPNINDHKDSGIYQGKIFGAADGLHQEGAGTYATGEGTAEMEGRS